MHNKKPFLSFFIILVIMMISFADGAEGISDKEQIIIHDKVFKLVQSYEDLINQIGNDIADVDKTKSNLELFIDLFVNRKTLVYNDLDPQHLLSEYYEVETYASNLGLWYPDGQVIELGMDNALVSNIIDHGANVFSIDVAVEKKIDGNYMNRSMNANTEKLLFRIAFTREGLPENFKIAGVRDASSQNASFDNSSLVEVKSAGFDEDQVLKVQLYCKAVINDYANYLALLGNEEELEDDKVFYREAMAGLFSENDNIIFNDLEENVEDKYLSAAEYIASFGEIYPVINNISLNTDSADFGKVIKNDDGTFYVETHVDKFFSGKPRGKNLYRTQDRLIYKISFEKKGEGFANFVIEGIDNEGVNDALMSGAEPSQNINEFGKLGKLTRKGWYVGGSIFGGQGTILDQNIADLTLERNYHEWDIKPAISYGGQLSVSYMLNDFIGLESGIGYSLVQTEYSISSSNIPLDPNLLNLNILDNTIDPYGFVDPYSYFLNYPETGVDDEYYKIIQIESYDSLIKMEKIHFPLHFITSFGKSDKINIGLSFGIDVDYFFASKVIVSHGLMQYFSYFPQWAVDGNLYMFWDDDESVDLNLYKMNPEYDITYDINEIKSINKFNINSHFGVCAIIPLGYFISLDIGASYKTSIMDLSSNTKPYSDIFGQTEDNPELIPSHIFEHKPTKVNSILFEVGIKYKL